MTILDDLKYSLFGHPIQITVQGKPDENGESVRLSVTEPISALDAVIIVILVVLFLLFMWFYLSPLFRRKKTGSMDIEQGEVDGVEKTNRLTSWLQSRRDGDSGKFWNQSNASTPTARGLGFHTRPELARNDSSQSSFNTPPPAFGVSVTPPPPAYASPRQDSDEPVPQRIPALPLSSDQCPRGMPVAVPLERTSRLTIVDRPPRPQRHSSRSVQSQAGRSRRSSAAAQYPVTVSYTPSPLSPPVPIMSATASVQSQDSDESGLARSAPTARKVSDSTLHCEAHVPSRAVMVIHVPVGETPEPKKRAGSLSRMLSTKTGETDLDAEKSRFNAARQHMGEGEEERANVTVQL